MKIIALKVLVILYSLFFFLFDLSVTAAYDDLKSYSFNITKLNTSPANIDLETGPWPYHRFITLGSIKTYQLLISPSKGGSCPMHPHCSLYGYTAFKQCNPLEAFLKTADRLHRCGHDLDNYPTVEVEGYIKYFDPVNPLLASNETNNYNSNMFLADNYSFSNLDISVKKSENNDTLTAEKLLFEFAEMLQSEGSYDKAIIEYRRLLFYYPESDYRLHSLKAILRCHYSASNYLDAIHQGQRMLSENIEEDELAEIDFIIGNSFFKVGNFPIARTYYNDIINLKNDTYKEKSELLLALSFANESMWPDAESSFLSINNTSEYSNSADSCIKLVREGMALKEKKPVIAGFLSIMPGLGYLYDGYKQTALSSFIVNSLFFWSTYEAFHKDNESLGAMLSILSFGWYTGNIYGSVISANRKNIKNKSDLIAKFEIGFKF